MALSPYRPQDGWLVRRFFFVLLVIYGGFCAYRAYVWAKTWALPIPFLADYTGHHFNWGEISAAVLLTGSFAGAYYLIFLHQKTADFLVEVEAELRKVAWPEHKPIGSPKAELWGSTYVVIGVVVVMTVFIFAVDQFYALIAQYVFYM